jgi:predicted nucleotidyltransferase
MDDCDLRPYNGIMEIFVGHTLSAQNQAVINEGLLNDPTRPVSRIARSLLPYLRILVDEFSPSAVILFGSYAYGQPDRDSDIDLLIVKDLSESPVREASRIRAAWRELRRSGPLLGFDLMVESPERHEERLRRSAYYREIVSKGLRLV